MAPGHITSSPEAELGLPDDHRAACRQPLSAVASRWLGYAIFFCLLFFTAALPHSIKGAQHGWRIASLLWLLKLAVDRKRPHPQALSAPLLAYITLSGASSLLSVDPMLSWDRMKIVCLVLTGILIAQSLDRLSQIRTLVVLLLLSSFAVAVFTGWQYTYGIGVQIVQMPAGSPLSLAGVNTRDIITSIDGHTVHTPQQLARQFESTADRASIQVGYVRGFPLRKLTASVAGDAFARSGLGTQRLILKRGKPTRAQGHLGHYVVFAQMLMQLGCLAWAMVLTTGREKRLWQALSAVVFVAITCALVFTETRTALVGLGLGCFVALLMLTGRRSRIWAAALLGLVVIFSAVWLQYNRRVSWIDFDDPGTRFRVLMWQDGLRLVHQHPWFGIGMESVRNHWRQFNIRGFAQYHVVSHFHCDFLQIAVDRGLPALAAWLWFVVAYIRFLLTTLRNVRARSRFAAGVLAAALAAFVGFQLTSILHYNLGEEPLVTILFFYFGLAIAIDRICHQPGACDVE